MLTTLMCMILLCGCWDKEPEYGAPMTLRMTGVAGYPDLDPNLEFGLFVGVPIGADNVKFNVSQNGRVVPEKELKWAFDQTSVSRFFAYSPYDKSYTGQDIVSVSVPTDQTTAEKMLRGNLLTALVSGDPKDKAVELQAKHAMTAMVLSFDNRTGERITSVRAGRFLNEGSLDLITGSIKAVKQTDLISAIRCPDDEDSFCFIYIPQNVTPYFEVTLESGKVIVYDIPSQTTSRISEYPGTVVYLRNIQITESTGAVNMISDVSISLYPWITNGVPVTPSGSPYMSLADLKNVVPDKDGIFTVNLNKVTVTAVDRTNPLMSGLVIEDSTRAIHVWTAGNTTLEVGNTIVGPIAGIIDKPSDSEFNISYFYTANATIGKTKVLPSTEGTFAGLADMQDEMEFRRTVFRNVTLKDCFNGGNAVFVQDTVQVNVICQNVDIKLTAGVKGDLTGFPVRTANGVAIMIYDESQLMWLRKDAVDNVFTRCDRYGLYDLSNPDTAVYVMNAAENDLQCGLGFVSATSWAMQVTDMHNAESHYFLVYDCPTIPLMGHEYTIVLSVQGNSTLKSTTMYMECVKCNEDYVWFVDRSGKTGLIMGL